MVSAAEGDKNKEDSERAVLKPWHYIHPSTQQSNGPVSIYQLAGLLDAAVISVETLMWTEGQGSWAALKDLSELYGQLYYISSNGQSVPPGGLGDVQAAGSPDGGLASVAEGSQKEGRKGVVAASEPALVKPAKLADQALADFNAEMADLGEEIHTAVADAEPVERVETPPPEDREFEDDDGTIYEWNHKRRKFQPKAVNDDGGYKMEDMTFEMDEETIPVLEMPKEESESEEDKEDGKEKAQAAPKHIDTEKQMLELAEAANTGKEKSKVKKKGGEDVMERIAEKKRKAAEQAEAQKNWFDLKVNTSVYVTGLPDDVDEGQLAERFGQYGVVKPGEDGAPRVKIYKDKNTQMPKGDGLVTFLYEPSVELACKLADDDVFMPGMPKRMTVQPAKFEMHGSEYVPKKKANKKKTTKDRQKIAEKVLGWGGFDDKLKASQVTVILENLFDPDEIIAEPTLLKDLDADIKEESATLGPVEKVKVYAGNPKGVVSVKFKTEEGAQACLKKMDGRFFGGRQVTAKLWDGFTNFHVKLKESEEQIRARQEQYGRELENQEIQEQLKQEQLEAAAADVHAPV